MKRKIIEWSDRLIIDNGIVDEQHQKLIDLINELYNAFMEGKANDSLNKIIKELAIYTISHFKDEEKLFAKTNYPNKEEHYEKHQAFVNRIISFKEKLGKHETNLSNEILIFLSDWLKTHILVTDKKYVPYLKTTI